MRYINIYNNEFTYDNKLYIIIKHTKINDSNRTEMYYADLICDNQIIKIVTKKFYNKSISLYNFEHNIHCKLSTRLNSESIEYDILFCDTISKILIFPYVGKTLNDEYNLKKHILSDKLLMFNQLISYVDKLLKIGIIHNDIKPINLCISNNKLTLIDFGNAYIIPEDVDALNEINTTFNASSPEYFILAHTTFPKFPLYSNIFNNQQIKFLKLIEKMQHMTLAGILIGLLLDDIHFYYRTFLEITKYKLLNCETSDMKKRFEPINRLNIHKISEICLKKLILNNIDQNLIDIIMNMLSYDYNDRLSLSEIYDWIQNVYDDLKNK